ncbi:hypothetical protein N0V83_004430 [Neocucurbitaria cava]|uniref:AB hydrolase-1 domain-containing protein n=1 Tax=Neocucurbitaria cava TaxID=798079 RepID=A0A9W8Y947_9PLEO|nr:hypothetical protein N0V83_004430 [Neocucurbitaria cava]
MPSFTLETEHGLISVTDTGLKGDGPALLLIHGNSSSSKVFRHIIDSQAITAKWRIIAFDLPGHGASSNAPDPDKSYSMRGYADLAVHILQHLNITSVAVLGWSLGGHVGIEMVPLLASTSSPHIEMKGLMITGTPPALGKAQMRAGFNLPPEAADGDLGLPGKKDWSEEEAQAVAKFSAAAGKEDLFEEWMLNDARRTDGRARVMMSTKFAGGDGVDQRKVVEVADDVLLAVVNGGNEPFVNLDYLDGLKCKNLWKGKCMRMEGLQHAPFWEKPTDFESVLLEFMADCAGEN